MPWCSMGLGKLLERLILPPTPHYNLPYCQFEWCPVSARRHSPSRTWVIVINDRVLSYMESLAEEQSLQRSQAVEGGISSLFTSFWLHSCGFFWHTGEMKDSRVWRWRRGCGARAPPFWGILSEPEVPKQPVLLRTVQEPHLEGPHSHAFQRD